MVGLYSAAPTAGSGEPSTRERETKVFPGLLGRCYTMAATCDIMGLQVREHQKKEHAHMIRAYAA